MFCIECGQELNSDSEFCFKCGAKAATDESGGFCIQCGKKLPEDATFCIDCGAKVSTDDESSDEGDAVDTPSDVAEIYSIVDTSEIEVQQTPHRREMIGYDITHNVGNTPPRPQDESHSQQAIENEAALKKQRKLTMTLFSVTIILLVAVVGMVVFIVLNRDDENGEASANGQGTHQAVQPQVTIDDFDEIDDYYVHRVVTGHLDNHPGIPIGTAFDDFFVNPSWTYFYELADDDNRIDYVSFHGYFMHEGENAMGQIIFQFSSGGTSFEPIIFIIDGVWQDILLMRDVLDEIMEHR